ncbi:MAG: endonuclease/exonuclease/phosphatase family protein [Bifidobacteriaceae bacterium]|jgi:endonuclease/exonuclease/phosphatase (EEP) superfamily protein YafD|nr:endonuclease/exonuclease/phosphatase family protein [Bifidobacteriaceae bacterium]
MFRYGGAVAFEAEGTPRGVTVADGVLGGVPVEAGDFDVTVTATVGAQQASASLVLRVVGAGQTRADELAVMSYNDWAPETEESRSMELRSFAASGADVILIQEGAQATVEWIADQLGWYMASPRLISRYPILETASGGSWTGALINADPVAGRVVWVVSAHLLAYPYGPYSVRDGHSLESVLADEESYRAGSSGMAGILAQFADQIAGADEIPVIVGGDFNTPSHLDWVEAAKASHLGWAVEWPVTLKAAQAGLIDSFRAVNPDPVAVPGNTWTPRDAADMQDRIDYVLYKGDALEPVTSEVFMGPGGGADPLTYWQSDHAAVRTVFSWLSTADPEPPALALSATSGFKCIAGKAYLTVTAFNDSDQAAAITVTTPFGVKVFPSITAGKSGFHSFTTRLPSYSGVPVAVTGQALADPTLTGAAAETVAAASCI